MALDLDLDLWMIMTGGMGFVEEEGHVEMVVVVAPTWMAMWLMDC